MASSPCRSASTATASAADTDVFSDDSGVDVKPQRGDVVTSPVESRRNKRKSSEPKKRKDVLQMKRFRWDTDEEVDNEDAYEAIERERPSSGDSGCHVEVTPEVTPAAPAESSYQSLVKSDVVQPEKKKRQRQWRKPKSDKSSSAKVGEPAAILPAFRQSVIRKHEAPSTSSATHDPPSSHPVSSLQLPSHSVPSHQLTSHPALVQSCSSSNAPNDPGSTGNPSSAPDYDVLLDSQDDNSNESNRTSCKGGLGRPRNYKSMSRQRRIEANARERTRVHTISAAFENLRRAVPAYAHNQKLSKLAILRIASAYIVALACLNQQDYSQEQSQPSLADCVEQCTRTIQAEGRSRRRSSKD